MSLHAVRHERILELLDETASVRVSRLAKQLEVSEMTVRRDLQLLEEQGKLRRVHGGAVLTAPLALEPASTRAARQQAEKESIADLAAGFIAPDMNVYIGGGSTTRPLADRATLGPAARFTTNSIAIAETISDQSPRDVHLLGGALRAGARTMIGPETIEMIERRLFDVVFIGITAIDAEEGFLEPTEWHAWLVRTLKRRAGKMIVLADHRKFDARSDFRVLAFDEANVLITDRQPLQNHAEQMADTGLDVLWPSART